jgi:hypothetical protein
LGNGHRVEASFVLRRSDRSLQVAANSLFRYRIGWIVFVKEGARVEARILEK